MTTPQMPETTTEKDAYIWIQELTAWGRQGWAEAERLEAVVNDCYTALGTTFYMDPPDGGDPGIAVMIGRMKAHRDELLAERDEARARVKELSEEPLVTDRVRSVLYGERIDALRARVRELKQRLGEPNE